MHCPTCGKDMELLKQDVSRSRIHEEEVYNRCIYGCQNDDVWVTVEIPVPPKVVEPKMISVKV